MPSGNSSSCCRVGDRGMYWIPPCRASPCRRLLVVVRVEKISSYGHANSARLPPRESPSRQEASAREPLRHICVHLLNLSAADGDSSCRHHAWPVPNTPTPPTATGPRMGRQKPTGGGCRHRGGVLGPAPRGALALSPPQGGDSQACGVARHVTVAWHVAVAWKPFWSSCF